MKKTMMKISALAMAAMMAVPSLAMAEAPTSAVPTPAPRLETNLEEREAATTETQTDADRDTKGYGYWEQFAYGYNQIGGTFYAQWNGTYTIHVRSHDWQRVNVSYFSDGSWKQTYGYGSFTITARAPLGSYISVSAYSPTGSFLELNWIY